MFNHRTWEVGPVDKESIMIKSKSTAFLFIAALTLLFVQSALSDDTYQLRHTFEFSSNQLSFEQLLGYDVVRLEGGDFLSELGRPMLPSKQIRIALPSGMTVKGVRVVNSEMEEIPGEFHIFPSQPPRRIVDFDEDIELVEPDPEVYSSQPYPPNTVELVYQTDLAGQSMAVILLYPLQYVPAEKKLTLCTSLTLVIEGEAGYVCGDYLSPNVSEKNRRAYQQMLEDMVANPQEVQLQTTIKGTGSADLPDGAFDHVIITSSSFSSYFQPLVDWHTQKGVRDTVITTAWIYLNYSGADTQKIRSFIVDANSNWGTSYFLLGGENETVPFAYRTYYQQNTPSDQYYSDFDDDWTHEVFVGRVSAGSSSEVTTFVNKVLKYEKDPPITDYPQKALLIGMDLDDYTHAEYLKETIDGYLPVGFNVTKVYDSHLSNHRSAVINALNAGQNLVNHADHANETSMGTGWVNHYWDINRTDVDNLTNDDKMSIVVSLSCESNKMDYNDCISEYFVIRNPNQAGVGFTGNTRHGWGYMGNLYSLSCKLDLEWWAGLFNRNKHELGQILVDSKHNFSTSNPDMNLKRHCEWTFNLLGEPEMPVWTDQPGSFSVTHPSTIPPGTSSFPVHVDDAAKAPVNQAYVCLWKEGEVYLTGYTNSLGDITFDPAPSSQGNIYVTVTKHNFLPYEQTVEISGYILGDSNTDGIIDPADVVYLINYLFKEGPVPDPLEAGDANCDGSVGPADVVYLINYLFKDGPPPSC
jgi:hypothetical protein